MKLIPAYVKSVCHIEELHLISGSKTEKSKHFFKFLLFSQDISKQSFMIVSFIFQVCRETAQEATDQWPLESKTTHITDNTCFLFISAVNEYESEVFSVQTSQQCVMQGAMSAAEDWGYI